MVKPWAKLTKLTNKVTKFPKDGVNGQKWTKLTKLTNKLTKFWQKE
jgi:hypothetical protein